MLKFPPCFSCSSSTSIPAVPTKTTSVYDTSLGPTSLTWSRSLLGLSIIADLHLFPSLATENDTSSRNNQESISNIEPNSQKSQLPQTDPEPPYENLQFRIFLPLPFRRKGSKTLNSKTSSGRRRCIVNITWDLSRAIFSRACGPEPLSGFFFAISVDGRILLIAGDRPNEAFRRIKSAKHGKIATDPVSKKLEVKLGEIGRNPSWRAMARIAGKEREVLISFDLEKRRMRLAVNGERVSHVRRLRWNFRGSERVEMEGGDRVHVSWDLFRFLFGSGGKRSGNDAVIVLRFENGEEGQFGKCGDWSEEGSSRSWTTATSWQSVDDWEGSEYDRMRKSDSDTSFTLVIGARRR